MVFSGCARACAAGARMSYAAEASASRSEVALRAVMFFRANAICACLPLLCFKMGNVIYDIKTMHSGFCILKVLSYLDHCAVVGVTQVLPQIRFSMSHAPAMHFRMFCIPYVFVGIIMNSVSCVPATHLRFRL